MGLALEGIKVLDLSRLLPGPYCSMILADMGAEVIKVEEIQPRFNIGEWLGGIASPDAETKELIRVYQFMSRNKESLALDLKTVEAREIFYKLARKADVVLEEFRPGVTRKLGVDYATLSKINPKIVYCSISGYGQDGPYRDLPGHDSNYVGMAGILGITGTLDGKYVLPGITMADFSSGEQAVIGILCALLAREKTGKGQYVDVAMLDGLVSWTAVRYGIQFFATGKQPQTGGRPSHVYKAKDGKRLCLAPAEPWFWERLCRALGLEEYIPYRQEVMSWIPDNLEKRDEIVSRMAEVFSTKSREEWLRILREVDTCVSSVYTLEEVFSDPQVIYRQMITEVNDPGLGKIKQVGVLPKLSETPGSIRTLPPRHGEHTDKILHGLGYAVKQIDDFREAGVVK